MIRITGGTDTAVGSLFAGSQGEALRREAERLFATIRTAGLVENEPGVSRDSYGFRESGAMMTGSRFCILIPRGAVSLISR